MLAGTGQNYKLIAEMIPKGQKMYKYIFFVFLVSNKFIILNITISSLIYHLSAIAISQYVN